MRILSLTLAVVSLLALSCASKRDTVRKPTSVTVEQLRSAPERFDGTRVLVTGFLMQPIGGDVTMYQTAPVYLFYRPGTGIRLALIPGQQDLMPLQLKRCSVEGIFHAGNAPDGRNRIGEITHLELAERNF